MINTVLMALKLYSFSSVFIVIVSICMHVKIHIIFNTIMEASFIYYDIFFTLKHKVDVIFICPISTDVQSKVFVAKLCC